MNERLPTGCWPVMLTAFRSDGVIDWKGMDALTDWYIEEGVDGLFAVCLSSEMFELSGEERIALATHAVRRAAGRIPVVATGTFGGSIEAQADEILRMAETGVSAVVVNVSQLASVTESDAVWWQRCERLLALTGETPLGLYECPVPYHRLLSPELLGRAAASGSFFFHKDTVCRMAPIREKIAAVQGTPMRWYNANAAMLLDSLSAGGDGYCGTAANLVPALYVWLCRHASSHPVRARRVQRFLSIANAVVTHHYPVSAKVFLARGGVPVGPMCRTTQAEFREHELLTLDHLREAADDLLEIVSCTPDDVALCGCRAVDRVAAFCDYSSSR